VPRAPRNCAFLQVRPSRHINMYMLAHTRARTHTYACACALPDAYTLVLPRSQNTHACLCACAHACMLRQVGPEVLTLRMPHAGRCPPSRPGAAAFCIGGPVPHGAGAWLLAGVALGALCKHCMMYWRPCASWSRSLATGRCGFGCTLQALHDMPLAHGLNRPQSTKHVPLCSLVFCAHALLAGQCLHRLCMRSHPLRPASSCKAWCCSTSVCSAATSPPLVNSVPSIAQGAPELIFCCKQAKWLLPPHA